MKFQIEEIIIWPSKTNFNPRELKFELGKVNVITGASRTGKTAIIPIVDYCLASNSCSIPIEVIRDNASWYGIIIALKDDKILVARKVPEGNNSSNEFYFSRGKDIVIPHAIDSGNETQDGIKVKLNSILQLPYINRDNEDSGYDNMLSFRDLSHLLFQSQDIVANQAVLFYKTHKTEHREKLRRWFPVILGVETIEVIEARRKLKEVESELRQKQQEFTKAKNVSIRWLNTLITELEESSLFGLYDEIIPKDMSQDELVLLAKSIIEKNPTNVIISEKSIRTIQAEIQEIENLENENAEKIATISKRLKNISDVQNTLKKFDDGIKRKTNRLGISEWFILNRKDANKCPLCGGLDHPNASLEIEKIHKALKRYEEDLSSPIELPSAVSREKMNLEKELQKLLITKQLLQERYSALCAKNEESKIYAQQREDMYKYLGRLEYTIKMIEQLSDTGNLTTEIQNLEEEKKLLESIINKSNTEALKKLALIKISQLMFARLKTLDVDPKYQAVPPSFSIEELSVLVKDSFGYDHLLSEVGSASNWVSFHLALTCALQEFFINEIKPFSSVPSFIIYDQPSQVYFPRTKLLDNEDPKYEIDTDIEAVKKIFITLANSVKSTNGAWQVIVLDHANSDVYKEIDGVHEVEEWRNGKKLIPEEWYN